MSSSGSKNRTKILNILFGGTIICSKREYYVNDVQTDSIYFTQVAQAPAEELARR